MPSLAKILNRNVLAYRYSAATNEKSYFFDNSRLSASGDTTSQAKHIDFPDYVYNDYGLTVVLDLWSSILAIGYRLAYPMKLTCLYCSILVSSPP